MSEESTQASGTVKWFSSEKGYGFITDLKGIDRYFNVQSVIGAALPKNGAEVTFHETEGHKGPAAAKVEIVSQADRASDDRIACPGCEKRIIPRIITDQGTLTRLVCPYCGTTINRFNDWRWVVFILFAFAFVLLVVILSHGN